MCGTCGCATETHDDVKSLFREHRVLHLGERRVIDMEQAVLAKNDRLAAENRGWFAGRSVAALNLVSSPGAGKTTLLERTIRELAGRVGISVVEGDQATANDAERIRAAGARAVQINTGTGCHLDAAMVAGALDELDPARGSLVMIENVGNLVCPALFDLGERAKVLLASVTEGDDKPLKYPHMFRAASLVLLSKIDLAPYVPFDRARFMTAVAEVNPRARVLAISSTTGEGLAAWYGWLAEHVPPPTSGQGVER
jgi:hydrogenase nickel incorporation protein HypB